MNDGERTTGQNESYSLNSRHESRSWGIRLLETPPWAKSSIYSVRQSVLSPCEAPQRQTSPDMASDSLSDARASDKIAEELVAEELVEQVNIHGEKILDDDRPFGDAGGRNQRERALLRKQDLMIMPLRTLSYMFSYLVG